MMLTIDGKAPPRCGLMGPGHFWFQQFAYFIAENMHPDAVISYMDLEGGSFHPTYDSLREFSINTIGEKKFELIQELHARRRKAQPSKIITQLCKQIYGQHIPKCVSNLVEMFEDSRSYDIETAKLRSHRRSFAFADSGSGKWNLANMLDDFDPSIANRNAYEEFFVRGGVANMGSIRPRGLSISASSPECKAFYDFQAQEIKISEMLTSVLPSSTPRHLIIDSIPSGLSPDCLPSIPTREGKSKSLNLDFISLMKTQEPRQSAHFHVKNPQTWQINRADLERLMGRQNKSKVIRFNLFDVLTGKAEKK